MHVTGELNACKHAECADRGSPAPAAGNPAQVAGAGDLLRAVMTLTVAGLSTCTPWATRPGQGDPRATHAG